MFFKHPLSELPRDQLLPALIEHAKTSRIKFQESLDTVLQLLRSHEPLQAITTLAAFGLSSQMTDDGTYTSLLKNNRFNQAHVELAQAFSLTIPYAEIRDIPPHGSTIQQLFDLLPELGVSFAHQRMVVMEEQRSEEQKAITLVQELLRMHTQGVRNWGYFDNVLRIVNELYKPLDDAFAGYVGLSVTQLAAAFLHLIRRSEREINTAMKRLRQVLSERSVAAMVRRYYALNPELSGAPEDLLDILARERLTIDQTKVLILSHVQYRLPEIYMFSAALIASQLGVAEDLVKKAFDKLRNHLKSPAVA